MKRIALALAALTAALILLTLLPGCRTTAPEPRGPAIDFAESRRLGRDAFGNKDFSAAAKHFRNALAIAPTHPSLLYNVAAMETLTGNHEAALAALERLSALDLYLNIGAEEIFAPLRSEDRFQEVVRKLAASRESQLATSDPVVRFTGRGLIPEGLAWDEKNGVFLVGSVRERKILRVSREGQTTEFAGSGSGLLSAMGMRVDSAKRLLWVATSAAPQMERFQPADRGIAKVMKFDLDSGDLLATYPLESAPASASTAATPEHWFGDLTLAADGTVYVTDSTQPEIYRISPSNDRLELLIRDDRFQSLQGVDLSRDGRSIFVADYSTGIYRIDLRTKKVFHLTSPSGASMIGIDGIYRCGSDLLAVQNGINPHRLIRLRLDARSESVRDVEVIDKNHPQYNEPTLGLVMDGRFAYIANGQWEAVDKDGNLLKSDELTDPVILGFDARCR